MWKGLGANLDDKFAFQLIVIGKVVAYAYFCSNVSIFAYLNF